MLRSRKTYLFGVPLLVIAGVAALFIWGWLQPKPQGYAPTPIPSVVDAASEIDVEPPAGIAPESGAAAEPEVATEPEAQSATDTTQEPVAQPVTDPVVEPPADTEVAPALPESILYTVDTRDRGEWVFFDFTLGHIVSTSFDETDWDLAFKRTKLLTNSGATNSDGHSGAINLGEMTLEEAVLPPELNFVADAWAGEDGDELRNAAISRWYNYSFIRHVISAKSNVYVVRTRSDQLALVRFESYYCDDSSAGCVTFFYRLVPPLE